MISNYKVHLLFGLMALECPDELYGMQHEKSKKQESKHETMSNNKMKISDPDDDHKFGTGLFGQLKKLARKSSRDEVKIEESDEVAVTKLSRPTRQVNVSSSVMNINDIKHPSSPESERKPEEKLFDTLRIIDKNKMLEEKKGALLVFDLISKLEQTCKNETFKKEHGEIYTITQELTELMKNKSKPMFSEDEEAELKLCKMALKLKEQKNQRSATLSASPPNK